MTKKSEDYENRYSNDPNQRQKFKRDLEDLFKEIKPTFHVSGFQHPKLPVIHKGKVELMHWGLIPNWVKSDKEASEIWNKTLNARAETLAEKASFRMPFHNQRCVIMVDGYYEYFNYGGRAYPFHISLKDKSPMFLAGVYDTYISGRGNKVNTVSIVTTKANTVLEKIHVNKSGKKGRMPFVLRDEDHFQWLNEEIEENALQDFVYSRDSDEFLLKTVKSLKGKQGVGNSPEAREPFDYPELALILDLF